MKKANVFLMIILCLYGFIYMATTKKEIFDENYQKMSNLTSFFQKDSNYLYPLYACGRVNQFDSICVAIKDTTYHNWNTLADSVCSVATQFGLPGRHVFIINNFGNSPDTIANKNCP